VQPPAYDRRGYPPQVPTPDDRRFRPDDDSPDGYSIGDEYAAAPPPDAEHTTPFTEPSLFPPAAHAPQPHDGPTPPPTGSAPAGGVPGPYGSDLPYGATGSDVAGGVYGGPPAAGPAPAGAPSGSPRYGWQPASRRARQSSRLRWAVAILVIFTLISLLSRACSAIVGDDDGAGSDPTSRTPDSDITTSWVVTPPDIDPSAIGADFSLGLDGAFTGPEIVDDGLVTVGFDEVVALELP